MYILNNLEEKVELYFIIMHDDEISILYGQFIGNIYNLFDSLEDE